MAEISIFLQYILGESSLELNFEQLSHSVFCMKIAHLVVAMVMTLP